MNEGSPVTLHGTFSDPGLADNFTFHWQVTSDTMYEGWKRAVERSRDWARG